MSSVFYVMHNGNVPNIPFSVLLVKMTLQQAKGWQSVVGLDVFLVEKDLMVSDLFFWYYIYLAAL